MALDHELPTDTPSPTSIDFDPPAYSQPTLPPPAEEPAAPSLPARWGARFVAGGLLAVAVATGGAYAFLPKAATPVAAAASAPAVRASVNAQLDQIIAGFPNQVALQACADSAERVPVVLYSAVDALHSGTATSELEAEIFAGVTPVTSPNLMLSAQRIGVLRTLEMKEPEASLIEPTIGHFQAYLVVFDAHTKQPLCQTHIESTSAKDTRWSNVSARALHDDFVTGVRKALFAAANRLHVELEL